MIPRDPLSSQPVAFKPAILLESETVDLLLCEFPLLASALAPDDLGPVAVNAAPVDVCFYDCHGGRPDALPTFIHEFAFPVVEGGVKLEAPLESFQAPCAKQFVAVEYAFLLHRVHA